MNLSMMVRFDVPSLNSSRVSRPGGVSTEVLHSSLTFSAQPPYVIHAGLVSFSLRPLYFGSRIAKRLSRTALAEQLGVTFQQVQKYEKGVNRLGAGRLSKIAALPASPEI